MILATYTGGAPGYLVIVGSLGPLALMAGVMYLSNKLVKRNRARAASADGAARVDHAA